MTKSKITLSEIAKLAGLSVATVSRVLHKPHLTTPEVQKRVNKVIRELDYNTEDILKPYIKQKDNDRILVIDNQFYTHQLIHRGLEDAAKIHGYKLLYLRFIYFTKAEIQEIITTIANYHVEGIIIINHSSYVDRLLKFYHALPPLLLVNQFMLKFPSLYFDNLSIGYKATQHLLQNGHEKIAIMLGHHDKMSTHHLHTGYNQALTRANVTINKEFIIKDCVNHELGAYKFEQLMNQINPPTAIICADNLCLNSSDDLGSKNDLIPNKHEQENGLIIQSVIEKAKEMNLVIPKQLSLFHIGHTKSFSVNHQLNFIDTLYKPLYKMGKNAMNLLTAIIDNHYSGSYSQIVDTELLTRHSVMKIK